MCNVPRCKTPGTTQPTGIRKDLQTVDCLNEPSLCFMDVSRMNMCLQAQLPSEDLGTHVLEEELGLGLDVETETLVHDVKHDALGVPYAASSHAKESATSAHSMEGTKDDMNSIGHMREWINPEQSTQCAKRPVFFAPHETATAASCKKAGNSVTFTQVYNKLKASRLKRISDNDLVRLTVPELFHLGYVVGISDTRIQVMKARRRRLNNRKSACGSARKRRAAIQEMMASNRKLSREHETQARRHGFLHRQNQQRLADESNAQANATAALQAKREVINNVEILRARLRLLGAKMDPKGILYGNQQEPKARASCHIPK